MILVTGASGHIGRVLVKELAKRYSEPILGTYFKHKFEKTDNIEPIKCDIRNSKEIEKIIDEYLPEYIYHLAGQTKIMESWDNPKETYKTNVLGTLNLLEAIRKADYMPRVFLAGSAAAYGSITSYTITEDKKLQPLNPYGVSKAAMELFVIPYHYTYGIKTIVGRMFNIVTPGKEWDVVNELGKQFALIKRKKRPAKIYVGFITKVRDYTHVSDAVQCIIRLTEKRITDHVYNICSGIGYSVSNLIDMYSELTDIEPKVLTDAKKFRPIDENCLVGDNTKVYKEIGWKPKRTIEEMLNEVYNYWLNVV